MMSGSIALMHSLLSFLALAAALYLGFALLALSQERNRRAVGIAASLPRAGTVLLRVAGYGLIALALPIALWRDGPGFGSLLWATLVSIGALAVVCTLTWKPLWLRPLVRIVQPFG